MATVFHACLYGRFIEIHEQPQEKKELNLSETLILSVNITFAPTHNFDFAYGLPPSEKPVLSGIDMKQVLVLTSLLLFLALPTITSEPSLPIKSSLSWLTK